MPKLNWKSETSREHMKNTLSAMKVKFDESCLESVYIDLQESGKIGEYYSCTRKVRYTTRVLATLAAYRQEEMREGVKQWFPYKCFKNCEGLYYHVGSKVEGRDYSSEKEEI